MTRVTIALTLLGLGMLFVAYAQGVRVIHGGNVLSHMYWATAALFFVGRYAKRTASRTVKIEANISVSNPRPRDLS
jgi:hypothetical protein